MSEKKVKQMYKIDFRVEDQPMESVSFKSEDFAFYFWSLLLRRDDLVYADRSSWDLEIPFPEVE